MTLDASEIEDGDTLVAVIGGSRERLQLAGIDAPEDSDNAKLQRDLTRTGSPNSPRTSSRAGARGR